MPSLRQGEGGRPAYPLMAILRVHLLQNWFGYSDPAMGSRCARPRFRTSLPAGILGAINGYPGDRGLLLRQGTIVDATIIHAHRSSIRFE